MNQDTILVVDDEKEIADLIEIYLKNDGYNVVKAYGGKACLEAFEQNKDIKVIVLDIMMPDVDGLEVCRTIRTKSNIPIIFLSAKAEDMDKIIGFGAGSDDYMTKPFNPLELLARVKSQMKRYQVLDREMANENVVVYRDVVIDKDAHVVKKNDEVVNLTPIEFEILYMLVKNKGKVFSTEEIFENVWQEKVYEVNNTVMVHIRRLREKIEDDAKQPTIIKTVWGVGYKVEA